MAHGPGYQTRINAVPGAFVPARQRAQQAGSRDIDSPAPHSHNPAHPGIVAIPVPA